MNTKYNFVSRLALYQGHNFIYFRELIIGMHINNVSLTLIIKCHKIHSRKFNWIKLRVGHISCQSEECITWIWAFYAKKQLNVYCHAPGPRFNNLARISRCDTHSHGVLVKQLSILIPKVRVPSGFHMSDDTIHHKLGYI